MGDNRRRKEHWRGRSKDKQRVMESGERPDLVAEEERERARQEVKSQRKKIVQVEENKEEKTSSDTLGFEPDLPAILNKVLRDPKFPDKVSKSPGLMQLLLNRMMGSGLEQTIIVEPTVYQVVQTPEGIELIGLRPLGPEPSGPAEGLNFSGKTGNAPPPHPPKSPSPHNSCIGGENEFGKLGMDITTG